MKKPVIENLLHCPYKFLSWKRLRMNDKGKFAHMAVYGKKQKFIPLSLLNGIQYIVQHLLAFKWII
jgi:hypothetical protein